MSEVSVIAHLFGAVIIAVGMSYSMWRMSRTWNAEDDARHRAQFAPRSRY